MITAKENYKKWHPDQFSDSAIIKKATLGRDFLEYHLSKISGHSKEKAFERFCKALLEVEVCPNLIPQTGPTGGGDSKVDTETYPVAEQLTESWLFGYGDKAGSERWAFAISAKTDWRPKVRSDVQKIAKTITDGRKYTKIFFVTNQQISDKKRADMEDELRKKYDTDVRIFSMDWLLDATFRNEVNKQIAVSTLGLSENLIDEKRIGEKDYTRQQRLEETENNLKMLSNNMKASEIINNARISVVLSRELEKPEQETLTRIDRYKRLAKEYGNTIDLADAIYESAWTIFWWYPSTTRFYNNYKEFEKIATETKSSYMFEKLCTLWLNLFTITQREQENIIDLDQHRHILESIYEYLTSDESKPNTLLSARTSFQPIRLARGDSLDDVVNNYIDIVNKSENSLEIDVRSIAKMIQSIPIFQEAKDYDHLFDLLVARLSKEKQESEAAKMYATRGRRLIKSAPIKALAFLSKAVLSFHNEANADLLTRTVFMMAHLFEELGLHWAARNYFFYVVTYCFNEYMKKGEITPLFALAANELKWIELQQGRVIFASEMNIIELLARNAYPDTIPEDINNFDVLLAFTFFKTPYEKLIHLGKLPKYLEQKGLPLSAIACRYELGYYDKILLHEHHGNKDEVDKHMKAWANQPAWDQIRYDPWYGFEEESILKSRIMGCNFHIHSENDMFSIEFATTLLSMLECFLGTGFHNDIISRANSFEIEIRKVSKEAFSIEMVYDRANPTYMLIKISEFSYSEFQFAHKRLLDKSIEIISTIISTMISSNDDFQNLKEMVENESVLARTEVFADSLFYGFSTFGPEIFSYSWVINEYEEEQINRSEKVLLREKDSASEGEAVEEGKVIFGLPPDYSHQPYKNDEIFMDDIINIPLWDVSDWCGAMYLFHPNYPPVLSLMYRNEAGLKIFDEWIKKYGTDDSENAIGIRIIKGIDSDHPYYYRMGIGANSFFSQYKAHENCVVISPCRMHTMQPNNDKNIGLFENSQSQRGDFIIFPSIIRSGNEFPEGHPEKQILKHAESLKIINAYDIKKTDILAVESIIPSDNPSIPSGYEDCDLIEILKHKKKMADLE